MYDHWNKSHSCSKFTDVVEGDEDLAVMIRITGGPHTRIKAPFIVLKSKAFS